jgi:hypothetical protein
MLSWYHRLWRFVTQAGLTAEPVSGRRGRRVRPQVEGLEERLALNCGHLRPLRFHPPPVFAGSVTHVGEVITIRRGDAGPAFSIYVHNLQGNWTLHGTLQGVPVVLRAHPKHSHLIDIVLKGEVHFPLDGASFITGVRPAHCHHPPPPGIGYGFGAGFGGGIGGGYGFGGGFGGGIGGSIGGGYGGGF